MKVLDPFQYLDHNALELCHVKAHFHVDQTLEIVLQVLKHQIVAPSKLVFPACYISSQCQWVNESLPLDDRRFSSLTTFSCSSSFKYLISLIAVIGNYRFWFNNMWRSSYPILLIDHVQLLQGNELPLSRHWVYMLTFIHLSDRKERRWKIVLKLTRMCLPLSFQAFRTNRACIAGQLSDRNQRSRAAASSQSVVIQAH